MKKKIVIGLVAAVVLVGASVFAFTSAGNMLKGNVINGVNCTNVNKQYMTISAAFIKESMVKVGPNAPALTVLENLVTGYNNLKSSKTEMKNIQTCNSAKLVEGLYSAMTTKLGNVKKDKAAFDSLANNLRAGAVVQTGVNLDMPAGTPDIYKDMRMAKYNLSYSVAKTFPAGSKLYLYMFNGSYDLKAGDGLQKGLDLVNTFNAFIYDSPDASIDLDGQTGIRFQIPNFKSGVVSFFVKHYKWDTVEKAYVTLVVRDANDKYVTELGSGMKVVNVVKK